MRNPAVDPGARPEPSPSAEDLAADRIRPLGRLVVALSGGVDSAALLAVAARTLGPENVVAVTGRSAAVTEEELDDARRIAILLGVRHEVVETHEMERPGYKMNNGERCFHCRTELFEILERFARINHFSSIAYGAIVDDLGEHRPGMDAARQRGVHAPLLDAGLGKADVRGIAARFELHVKEKPASACLASRIPVGTTVTPERLEQVARAERGLKALGFAIVRVRHHGDVARIEVAPSEIARFADEGLRDLAVRAVREAGFSQAVVDPAGYRPGGGISEGLYSIGPRRDGGQ
ncbi:MAG TPA: ATP-dependent sacrificial sulfur transferase LarE [Candidatus Sulfotelmatobacter sp.]|jgi:uncharacterized protein|nr:ATP-dependent sacrificial sulfur transferase LarE [Candidatus Sulfotelmatobacter sp.]